MVVLLVHVIHITYIMVDVMLFDNNHCVTEGPLWKNFLKTIETHDDFIPFNKFFDLGSLDVDSVVMYCIY